MKRTDKPLHVPYELLTLSILRDSTSALLEYRTNSTSAAAFALVNAGGIRATIDQGAITRGEVLTSFPFGNAVVEVPYTGSELRQIFEGLVSGVNQRNGREVTSFFQVSAGVRVEYDPEGEVGSRLVRLTVGEDVVDADEETKYTIVTLDFLTGGGDNILEAVEDGVVVLDTIDEVLTNYIQAHSPIDFELDGRIAVVAGSASGSNSTGPTGTGDGASATTAATGTGSGDRLVLNLALLGFITSMAAVVVWP